MAFGERVRAWAEGAAAPHPDDRQALATCWTSADPVLRIAAHCYRAGEHQASLRFDDALVESLTAQELLAGHPSSAGRSSHPVIDPVQIESWARYVHADVLDELGRFDEALTWIESATDLADEHRLELSWARAVSKQIWVTRRLGDARQAANLLRRLAARLSPRSHLLCAALSATLAWLDRPETALSYAERCLTLPGGQTRRARDHRDLARVLTRLERFDEARHHLDLASAHLGQRPATAAGRYMLLNAEYHLAMATRDFRRAGELAEACAAWVPDPDALPAHVARLGIARAQHANGGIAEMTATLEAVAVDRLSAEHRLMARRLEAAAAERAGDWPRAAHALGEARDVLASRHLAIPAVLLVEAELAVNDPFNAELIPGGGDGRVAEFNRAVATRDQLLMAAAKDLRGPIAVFEIATDLLAADDVDAQRVALLVERGLAEMELLVAQLRDGERAERGSPRTGPATAIEVVADTLPHVTPIASGRGITIDVTGVATVPLPGAARLVSALTTLLAQAVRAAPRDSVARLHVDDRAPRFTITIEAVDAAPSGWTVIDSITAATAGGPNAWRLAADHVAETGGAVRVEWTTDRQVRITL